MTANQIRYWQNVETERSNRARESETNRANVATERLRGAELSETRRSNLARETETYRSNVAKEQHNAAALAQQAQLAEYNAKVQDYLAQQERYSKEMMFYDKLGVEQDQWYTEQLARNLWSGYDRLANIVGGLYNAGFLVEPRMRNSNGDVLLP